MTNKKILTKVALNSSNSISIFFFYISAINPQQFYNTDHLQMQPEFNKFIYQNFGIVFFVCYILSILNDFKYK
jgi:hypothetical protein